MAEAARLNLNIFDAPDSLDTEPLVRVANAVNEAGPQWLAAGNVNVKLVDDEVIREFNRLYAGNDYVTDVLSFSYLEDGQPAEGEIGDIIISLPTAERQAAAAGTGTPIEVALLTLHGIMHVHGLDHAEAGEREAMDAWQREFMTAAGLPYRDFKWE